MNVHTYIPTYVHRYVQLFVPCTVRAKVTTYVRRMVSIPTSPSSFNLSSFSLSNRGTIERGPLATSAHSMPPTTRPPPPPDRREVVIERLSRDQSFGFVLQSNLHTKGCSISECYLQCMHDTQ